MWIINITKDEMYCLHDTIYNASGIDMSMTDTINMIEIIPREIIDIGIEWGLCDTVFGDKVFKWIKNSKILG